MRKSAFAVLAAFIAAVCISLTGCTVDPPQATDSLPATDWQIHFNRESGKITAIFDHEDPTNEIYRDATFDEKEDLALPFAFDLPDYTEGNLLKGVFSMNGKDYPTTVEVYWSLGATNWEAQAMYYNKHIASVQTVGALVEKTEEPQQNASTSPDEAGYEFNLTTVVLGFVEEGVISTSPPTAIFGTTGKATIRQGPDFLVDGYNSGLPAEALVEQLTGVPVDPNGVYSYTMGCATYEISLLNGEEIQTWINQLPVNTDGVQVYYRSSTTSARVDTAEPCDISVQDPLTTPGQDNPGTFVTDPEPEQQQDDTQNG